MIYIDTLDKRCFYLMQFLQKEKFEIAQFDDYKNFKNGDVFIFSPAKKIDLNFSKIFPQNSKVICGNLPIDVLQDFAKRSIKYFNVTLDEKFIVQNAILTAEGLLAIVLLKTDFALKETKLLVLGGGRLAKAYAILFEKLGVKTTILARREVEIAQSLLYASNSGNLSEFDKIAKNFNVIVNTIPAKIFEKENLKHIKKDTLFVETASVKCLDESLVKNFEFVFAPGLPGKYCSFSAAKALFDIVLKEIKNG